MCSVDSGAPLIRSSVLAPAQLMGALFMGNKVCLKCDSKVSVVMEQTLRLLHHCGMPLTDVDFMNGDGPTTHALLMKAEPRMTLFTGSSKVAEILARDLRGKIKLEDAGWDWKVHMWCACVSRCAFTGDASAAVAVTTLSPLQFNTAVHLSDINQYNVCL
jgi:hypothetical protein